MSARHGFGGWPAPFALLAMVALSNAANAEAAQSPAAPQSRSDRLAGLSLDQLMDVEITSVSKKPQRLGDAAAAIYVITQEDIRRSGMFTLPELLRLVPGLDVARSDSRHWAISSRGFSDIYSSKLLVLVDGRSVYSVFAGVFWDQQAVPLQNIERIEIIRGPGATLWGANAVNGVVNIITKSAKETQGLTASVVGGTRASGSASVRYGGRLSDSIEYSAFLDAVNNLGLAPLAGDDASAETRAGARLDWVVSPADTVSAQGEYFLERTHDVLYLPSLVAPPIGVGTVQHSSGGDVQVNWSHRFSATSDIALKAYFDAATTQDFTSAVTVQTYDVEMVHRFALGTRHQVIWGGGYRDIAYATRANPYVQFNPSIGGETIYNGFVQDEFALTQALHLIGGVKLEHNSYTGWETEPTLRLLWEPASRHTFWAAVSRAARTPSVAEEFARINYVSTPGSGLSPPFTVAVLGDPGGQVSERLTSWEAGYRGTLTPRLSLDIATFYNRYDRLASLSGEPAVIELNPAPPHVLVAQRFSNALKGETHGAEVSGKWQVTPGWGLFASYSLLLGKLTGDGPNFDLTIQPNNLGHSPRYQAQVRSHLDLPWQTEFDAAVYRVGALPTAGVAAYTRLDLRLGWRPTRRLTFSLSGKNLLQARHQEFQAATYSTAKTVPRTFYLAVSAGF